MNILTTQTSRGSRNASARSFIHSLNILVKYVRLYGLQHRRTEAQFAATWKELRSGLPNDGEGGFLLGVSGQTLLLDGVALETRQAEKSFAQLLAAAGLASIHFTSRVSEDDFSNLVRAFAASGSKAQEIVKQIKETFGDSKNSTIRINEVKFIAADPTTGEISIAAQIAAQTLGPEFKEWLNDPHKLLQLIAASEGARNGGGDSEGSNGSSAGTSGSGGFFHSGGASSSQSAEGSTSPVVMPLEEQEVIKAIRLLTKFGEAGQGEGNAAQALQGELQSTDTNTKVNLQQLLESLASNVVAQQQTDTPLLMKAAEHMAIRFALERFQKGDVKVNAVHDMLEHMSRQMETLRGILRVQEDKMSKAGILVESHADILDRMFWAEVSDDGKKNVLLSDEAQCVPPRNIRQYLETLRERGENSVSQDILRNYASCIHLPSVESRSKAATGLSQLADLFATGTPFMFEATIEKVGAAVLSENDPEIKSLLSAAFVRLSTEACNRREFPALSQVCASLEEIAKNNPAAADELRPKISIENRLPEFIEEAIKLPGVPDELLDVLRRTSAASAEHVAERFFRCMRREECDRIVELTKRLGPEAADHLRELLRSGQPRQASSVIGLMSRMDVPAILEFLPLRLKEWNRFYHDVAARQIAYGAAHDRGRTLFELVEYLDPLVLPQVLDDVGMSGDKTVVAPLMVMAASGEAEGRSPLVQLKAIEALGRLRDTEAVPMLRNLLEAKKVWKWVHHRELRIAAAQALTRIDPRFAAQIMAESGLEASDMAVAPLDSTPSAWVRQRRYERIVLRRTVSGTLASSWGKSGIVIRELSLGGGMGTKDDSMRLGSEANIEISTGVRKIKANVLLRRSRVNEVGFEIVDTDLESRYRLRRLLVESVSASAADNDWGKERRS